MLSHATDKKIPEFETTAEKVIIPENFTHHLRVLHQSVDAKTLFTLTNDEFIDQIVALFPEAHLMNGEANETVEGLASNDMPLCSPSIRLYGKWHLEADRAIAGVLNLKLAYLGTEEAYFTFTKYQSPASKLTLASFKLIHQQVRELLKDNEDVKAAIWSILCNDLGKMYSLIRIHTHFYPHLPSDYNSHDVMLGRLLTDKPELFPGFMLLSSKHKDEIAKSFSTGFEFAQYSQLQAPAAALKGLPLLSPEAINLYVLHSIFDISGAAAKILDPAEKRNKFIEGSLTIDEETWVRCKMAGESLALFHMSAHSYQAVYRHYIQQRGLFFRIDPSTATGVALIRIAGMARIYKKDVEKLQRTWERLPAVTKSILETELNIEGDESRRAIFIGFGPAMLANGQNNVKKLFSKKAEKFGVKASSEELDAGLQEAIIATLDILGIIFEESRKQVQEMPSANRIFLSDCKKIAGRWAKDRGEKILTKNILNDMTLLKSGKLSLAKENSSFPDYGIAYSLQK